ncbi:MAG: BatA domain-containing protein [Bacteroidota bacterium]
MNFLYPQFLFALFATAIPVIIHLFNFRRYKRIFFTNVKFLREIKQETQSKSQLKHLLVLLSRILAITALVFAFAQPYIPVNTNSTITENKVISIYIDNSFSMDATNDYGRLFEQAKKKAMEIVSAYKPTDKFQLLTNDFEARHQRMINREEFIELLDEVKISPMVKTISEVVVRQSDILANLPSIHTGSGSTTRYAYLISDFQKSISNFGQLNNDTSINVSLIPVVARQTNNLFIDSCWFDSPIRQVNQPEELFVRIRNNSDDSYENIPIKLLINQTQKALASFSIDPNSSVVITLSFTLIKTGVQQAEISLTDYPVTFDDMFYFSFEVADNISVLCINGKGDEGRGTRDPEGVPYGAGGGRRSGESKYINSLFGKNEYFIFNNSFEENLNYSTLSENHLIILNELISISSGMSQELKRFIQNGGNVIVFPNPCIARTTDSKKQGYLCDPESYKDFLSLNLGVNYYTDIDTIDSRVTKVNIEHEIYSGVFEPGRTGQGKMPENIDLPVVSTHFKFSKKSRTNEEYLMKLQNGDSFLSRYSFGKGKVYLSSVPLSTDFSNFATHAIFVPVMYKIALHSQPQNRMFYTIGKDNTLEASNINLTGDNIFHIVKNSDKPGDDGFDIIPEHKIIGSMTNIFLHNQITHSGNYSLLIGETGIGGISFNYNRKESDLSYFDSDELLEILKTNGLSNFSILIDGNRNLTSLLNEMSEGKKLWKYFIILALLFLGIEILLLRLWK